MANEESSLDKAIRETAFAGIVLTELAGFKEDLKKLREEELQPIKSDLREVRDFIKPAAFVVGAVPTVIAGLAFLKSLGVF